MMMITFNEDYDVMYLIIYIPWEINKKLGILFNCQAHSSKDNYLLYFGMSKRVLLSAQSRKAVIMLAS